MVDLAALPTDARYDLPDRRATERELSTLQGLLSSAATHSLLILLQGMDAAGKDGVISYLTRHLNPQAIAIHAFRRPSREEAGRDFLWRAHRAVPAKGGIAIFHRSYYEDVLYPVVHGTIDAATAKRRYAHIRTFEELLFEHGTILLKFFLHVSPETQYKRLVARDQAVEKAWKRSEYDWQEREHWEAYQAAYAQAIAATDWTGGPWTIVPADHKASRNAKVLTTVVEALRPYRRDWLDMLTDTSEPTKSCSREVTSEPTKSCSREVQKLAAEKAADDRLRL